jgi:hypothetical protein
MAAWMVGRACPEHAVLGYEVDLQPDRGAATWIVVEEWHSALGVTVPACRWLAEVFPSGQVVLEEDLPHELASTFGTYPFR